MTLKLPRLPVPFPVPPFTRVTQTQVKRNVVTGLQRICPNPNVSISVSVPPKITFGCR